MFKYFCKQLYVYYMYVYRNDYARSNKWCRHFKRDNLLSFLSSKRECQIILCEHAETKISENNRDCTMVSATISAEYN